MDLNSSKLTSHEHDLHVADGRTGVAMEEDGRTAPFEASLVPYATDERRTPHGRCRRAPFHGPVARALGLNDWFSSEVWRASLIELVGTASLVFLSILGTTSCLNSSFTSPPLAIGLINGLLLTLHILAMAPASGGHVNPSITIATFFAGLTSLPRAAFYIVAQFAGSVLGAACARGVLPPVLATRYLLTGCTVSLPQLPLPPSPPLLPFVNSTSSNTSITSTPPPPFSPPSGLSIAQGLLSESIFTFALLFIAFGVALDQTQGALFGPIIAPIIIGVILSLLIFISGAIAPPGYTGVGMNPARCFGPAAAMGSEAGVLWENLWVFLVGPLLGALALGLLYNLVPPNHASVYSDPEQGMFHMFRVKAAAGAAGASGAIAAADGEAAGDGGRDGASSLLLHEKAPMLQDSLQGTGKPNLGAGSLDMRDTVQIVHE